MVVDNQKSSQNKLLLALKAIVNLTAPVKLLFSDIILLLFDNNVLTVITYKFMMF